MSSFFISYSDLFLTKPKVRSGHGCSNFGQCYLLDKLSISIRETNYVISCGKKIYAASYPGQFALPELPEEAWNRVQ